MLPVKVMVGKGAFWHIWVVPTILAVGSGLTVTVVVAQVVVLQVPL